MHGEVNVVYLIRTNQWKLFLLFHYYHDKRMIVQHEEWLTFKVSIQFSSNFHAVTGTPCAFRGPSSAIIKHQTPILLYHWDSVYVLTIYSSTIFSPSNPHAVTTTPCTLRAFCSNLFHPSTPPSNSYPNCTPVTFTNQIHPFTLHNSLSYLPCNPYNPTNFFFPHSTITKTLLKIL